MNDQRKLKRPNIGGVEMIDYKIRALYYLFLTDSLVILSIAHSDTKAYDYLYSVVADVVTTVFDLASVYTETVDIYNKNKIADYIIEDLQND